jgi:hypothetical protein
MEQGLQSSRKRTYPLNNPQSGHLCTRQYHEGHSGDASAQSLKRQRPEQNLTYAPYHEDVFVGGATYGFINGMPQAASSFDFLGDGLPTFQPLHSVTSLDHLTTEGLYLPQQIVGGNKSTTDPSVTYAGTNGTLSPRLNDKQQPHDAHDHVSITLGGLSEKSFTGLEDSNLDPRDGSSNGGHHGSFQSFDDAGR